MKFSQADSPASRFEGFPTFQELTPSPSSWYAGGLVETEVLSTKPSAHPEDGDGVTSRNVEYLLYLDSGPPPAGLRPE